MLKHGQGILNSKLKIETNGPRDSHLNYEQCQSNNPKNHPHRVALAPFSGVKAAVARERRETTYMVLASASDGLALGLALAPPETEPEPDAPESDSDGDGDSDTNARVSAPPTELPPW